MPGEVILKTIIKCPVCKFQKEEMMKIGTHVAFYTCQECEARIKPRQNECCVFCSYGTVPCPAAQAGKSSGGERKLSH
jgi:hypothetical protein